MGSPLGGIGDILKLLTKAGGAAEQFFVWGVLMGVVSTSLEPFNQELKNRLNSRTPVVPLSPAELADMVVRNIMAADDAKTEARKSGVPDKDFDYMVKNTGEPPAIGELLALYRRGGLDSDQMVKAIKQSHIRDEWKDAVLAMGIQFPTPTDILEAYLQGQIESDEAHEKYKKFGGDPDSFDLLYNTRGSAPTPTEAAVMANRGIIPWEGRGPGVVSFEQAFLEGPWRNKWLAPYRKHSEYLPPPRTVTAMIKEGSLSADEGLALLEKQGLAPELAQAYVVSATKQKTQKEHELTLALIEKLFSDQTISHDVAKADLVKLHYTEQDADFILSLWEAQRVDKFREKAINVVYSQYVESHLERTEASAKLDSVGVPSGQRDQLLVLWDLEKASRVKVLTPAQIKKAMNNGIITPDEAKDRIVKMGYRPEDADIFLAL